MKKFFRSLMLLIGADGTGLMCAVLALLAFAVITALTGCTHGLAPETSDGDRAVISRVEESWKLAYHSWSLEDDCMRNAQVITPSREKFQLICGKAAFFSIGCVQSRGVGTGRGKLLVVSPAVHPDDHDEALAHVTLHALVKCSTEQSSVQPDPKDPTDEAHMLPEIWIESAGPASVEAHILGGLKFRDGM